MTIVIIGEQQLLHVFIKSDFFMCIYFFWCEPKFTSTTKKENNTAGDNVCVFLVCVCASEQW